MNIINIYRPTLGSEILISISNVNFSFIEKLFYSYNFPLDVFSKNFVFINGCFYELVLIENF